MTALESIKQTIRSATSSEFERTVVLCDLHIGAHDPEFLKALLLFLEHVQPKRIVLNGDTTDAESVSQHGGNPRPPSFIEEMNELKNFLSVLRKICPKAIIVYLEGNHETRLTRYIIDNAPSLAGVLTLPEYLGLKGRRIEWVPTEDQPVRYGTVKILHGHQMRGGGQYVAKKLVEIWGEPGVTVICGHHHQDQIMPKLMHPRPAKGIVVGCGRTLNPAWAGGPTSWNHSIAVVDVFNDDSIASKTTLVDCNDGVIVWGNEVFRGN